MRVEWIIGWRRSSLVLGMAFKVSLCLVNAAAVGNGQRYHEASEIA